MVRLKARLFLGFFTATAVVLGRGVNQATNYYQQRRHPSLAFGWSARLPSVSSGERPLRLQQLRSANKSGSEVQPQEISAVPTSLLASVVAVASDVDGTLTTPDFGVSPRTVAALKEVLKSEVVFFPATGRTRAGVYRILGEEIASHLRAKNTPGVFIQGLVVYSGSGNEVLYELLLDASVVQEVVSFCEEKGVSLIAYSGDRIVCSTKDEQTDRVADCKEPMPEEVGPLVDAMASGMRIHKLILLDTSEAIDRVRPEMEQLVGNHATLTQGQPDMLEVLPAGASKGDGVAFLLKHLGIDPARLMALGNAENDVGMLHQAGVGVCVGNASPPARAAARFIAPTNGEDGAAVAIERMLSSKNPPTQ